MTIKALCFDFDGTLARFAGDFGALKSAVWDRLSLSPHLFQKGTERFVHHDRQEGASTFAEILKRVVSDLGHPDTPVRLLPKR